MNRRSSLPHTRSHAVGLSVQEPCERHGKYSFLSSPHSKTLARLLRCSNALFLPTNTPVNVHSLRQVRTAHSPRAQQTLRQQLLLLALDHQTQINHDLLRLLQTHLHTLPLNLLSHPHIRDELVRRHVDHLLHVTLTTVGRLRQLVTDDRRYVPHQLLDRPRTLSLRRLFPCCN